jgi:CRP-like cAMP-binding protein
MKLKGASPAVIALSKNGKKHPIAHVLRPGERTGPEGKPVGNQILLALGDREFRAIRSQLEFVSFRHHEILHESHHQVRSVCFPNDGLVSLVVVTRNGKTAEAGLVGNEGVVGLESIFGLRRSPLREVAQISGSAYRLPASALQKLFRRYPDLLFSLSRFAILNRMQISQTAACNRLHEVTQRLARWLLLTQDRVDSGFLAITHDFLATMLGTDRSSVSEAAALLQKRKIIQYARGAVRVLDRKALEQSSCECYQLIRQYQSDSDLAF